MFCFRRKYLMAALKKCKRKSSFICLFFVCLSLFCFYRIFYTHTPKSNLTPTWRAIGNVDSVYISRRLSSLKQSQTNEDSEFLHTLPYSVDTNIDFDPNLPNLRKRILSIINSTTPFTNPDSLHSDNLQNNFISNSNRGSLNIYVWRDHCSQSVDLLKVIVGFPYNPWKKYFTYSLTLLAQYEKFGQRIFGYLIPPISGRYMMEVTFSGNIEVWISPDDQPSHAVKHDLSSFASSNYIVLLVKRIVFDAIEKVTYLLANLVANKRQYFEIIQASKDKCVLEVKWRRPDSNEYQPVPSNYLSPYFSDNSIKSIPESYCQFPFHNPSDWINQFYHPLDDRNRIYALQTVDISAIEKQKRWSLPLCKYQPSYVERGSITNANDLTLLSTHPATKFYSYVEHPWILDYVISASHKNRLIRLFMHHLTFSYPNVQLSRLVNIEGLTDSINGDLYFIEVLVTVDVSDDRELLVSAYVVLGHHSMPQTILCQPVAMKMHRDTFVHFLVTHRNFAHMLKEFILSMERIYIETGDENFGVIIVNYPSPDINVESLMRRTKLKHWSIIEMDGAWEKTAAINLGIDSVSSPDDIIFTIDLSLHIPSYLPDSIRKHTFQGYSGFAPVVFYFACDSSMKNPNKGYYSLTGFGLISLYKSDWQRVGGMDTMRFKGKWGMEDNDVANRIIASGYVLFRLVMRDFYHQNHTYSGLWEK